MKFGKQIKRLADPAILNHYLAYDVLKKDPWLVNIDPEPHDDHLSSSMGRFYELLQHEMCKVNRFFQLQLRTLLDSGATGLCRGNVDPACSGFAKVIGEGVQLSEADGLVELDKFKHLNFTGFRRKIAKKFDKSTKSGVTLESASRFMPQLKRAFFAAHPLDGLLLSLSLGHAAVRRFQSGGQSARTCQVEIRART
eukprot:Skav220175  [mRNA]  locus=scaffold1271:97414:102586:+ [translate_table: standard]